MTFGRIEGVKASIYSARTETCPSVGLGLGVLTAFS